MSESSQSMGIVAEPPVGGWRLGAARAVWALHVGVIAFLLAGWALPWSSAWWVYAIGAPFIQIGWIAFDDYCWLSILEAKLRREPLVKETNEGIVHRSFVSELIESITGREAPPWVASAVSYFVLWGGFVIACTRLWNG